MAGENSSSREGEKKAISFLEPPAEKHGHEVRLCAQKDSYGWTYGD